VADTVFLMGDSIEAGSRRGPSGIIAAEAVKDTGGRAFGLSSLPCQTRRRAVPHFDSKYLVEKHIAGLGIPTPSARRPAFMENTLRVVGSVR